MDSGRKAFPNDIEALKGALAAARDERISEAARAAYAEAELAVARAKASDDQALIAHQQLRIEKLTRQLYGPRSERTSRLLDQIELQFEELESSGTEDEIAAEMAIAKTTTVAPFTRKRPARKPFPDHLPRERVIVPGPTTCLCCGSGRLRKLGEAVTETLESIFERLWEETGCRAVIAELAGKRKHGFELERAVFLTALHRLCESGSDRAADRWREDYAIVGVEGLDLHHLYRAGEELPEKEQDGRTPFAPRCLKDVVEERLFAHRRDLLTRLDLVFMDTTSL